MSAGVKESKELIRFVVALTNLIIEISGKNSVGMLLSVGKFLSVLQLAAPAFAGIKNALSEAQDGYSEEEKAQLYAEIDEIKSQNATVEQVTEAALKIGVGLSDLVGLLKKSDAESV